MDKQGPESNAAAGNWSESLLKSMYYVTLQHGGAFPHEIERLWCTVATVKRNVIPILEFLISRGLQEMNAQVRPAAKLSLIQSVQSAHI